MKVNNRFILAASLCGALSATAAPLDLSAAYNYQTFGNVNVYSLPVQAGIYAEINGGSTNSGNPFYINSTPGAIKDTVVIYTGSGGTGVTTNVSGFENAYGVPSGNVAAYTSMAGTVNIVDPGSKPEITNASNNSWDASLKALKSFLDGGTPIFLFNNNQTKNAEDLAIWAKLWVTDNNNALSGQYLYLTNENAVYGLGGTINGNASLYNAGNVLGNIAPSINPGTGQTDYILSGGTVCFNAAWIPQACDGTEAHLVDHNLGENQAAYAGDLPVLDGLLGTLFSSLNDTQLDQYTLHIDLQMGCAPGWLGNCDTKSLNNGYEQLFLVSSVTNNTNVPEPGSIALFGLALAGLAVTRRKGV